MIRTPDQRLRVFVSSTLEELAAERQAVRAAVESLRLTPVMFELGARPHPPRDLYRAYLEQSDVFVGVYWERYGWVGPDMDISGLEDEYLLSAAKPRLLYVKSPAPGREERLEAMLEEMRSAAVVCYKRFNSAEELQDLVASDLAVLLTERFDGPAVAAEPGAEPTELVRGNLPAPSTRLLGRQPELEAATKLLLREGAALVTLVGTGGSGKTRLALEIGLRLHDHFPDGVFLVNLEAIVDPKLVLLTIAGILGVTEGAGHASAHDLLRRHLHGRRLLLILDNFEQVLDAAPDVAGLLEVCSQTKLLVTSRAPLRIRAERTLPVLPLETPPPTADSSPEELSSYPVVRLFVERASAVRPDFAPSAATLPAVAEICRRLDGLPLAIELAAARSRIFAPEQLLTRLDRRFEILRGGPADAPARQSTLDRAIDWSYNLLGESERKLLRRLSVFRGGFTLEAAAAVCSDADGADGDTLSKCEALIDNSLLLAPRPDDVEPQLRMLETVREFAHDRLLECGEAEEFHARHAGYFLALATSGESGLYGSSQLLWHGRIDAELDNLRAAMEWGLDHDDHELSLRIATALWLFWWGHGHWREGLDWLERGLAGASTVSSHVRALALTRTGWLLHQFSENGRAIVLFRESIRLSREAGDRAATALALSNLGATLMSLGTYGEAISLMGEALEIRRELGIATGIYATLMNLGMAEAEQGNDERAVELLTESLSLARAAEDVDHVGLVLLNMAEQYIHQGGFDRAEACYREAEPISRLLDSRILAGYIARGRGLLALRTGALEQASALLRETMLAFQEVGDTEYALMNVEWLAQIAGARGDWVEAATLVSAAEALRESLPLLRQPRYDAEFERCRATAARALGDAGFNAAAARGRAMTVEDAVRSAAAGSRPVAEN